LPVATTSHGPPPDAMDMRVCGDGRTGAQPIQIAIAGFAAGPSVMGPLLSSSKVVVVAAWLLLPVRGRPRVADIM
jgi:hypothetical protein